MFGIRSSDLIVPGRNNKSKLIQIIGQENNGSELYVSIIFR